LLCIYQTCHSLLGYHTGTLWPGPALGMGEGGGERGQNVFAPTPGTKPGPAYFFFTSSRPVQEARDGRSTADHDPTCLLGSRSCCLHSHDAHRQGLRPPHGNTATEEKVYCSIACNFLNSLLLNIHKCLLFN
jgi:hypothetical protein